MSAQQLVEPGNHPPAPGLAGAVLRQRHLLTLGGTTVRITLSNEYGKGPLEVRSAHLALPADGDRIHVGSSRRVSFAGETSVTIAPGSTMRSDSIGLSCNAETELALTLAFGAVPPELTGHPGSRTTSYIGPAGPSDAPHLEPLQTTDHWYFSSGIEVRTSPGARAIVILGDSITDGRGSTTNQNDRYPNLLAKRLLARGGPPIAVLNQGIGGNRVLEKGLGPTILQRYQRDALALDGVEWVVLFAGINDLGALHGSDSQGPNAAQLIGAFRNIARKTRSGGKKIIAVTLLPFEGSFYFTEKGEKERQLLNSWLRTTNDLDGLIDLDAATRDPDHPSKLSSAVDGGDHLHPSAAGYRIMADAIDLDLFASAINVGAAGR